MIPGNSRLAQRTLDVPFSSIRKVFERARELEADGVTVARMEIGRPDFDTPQHIKEAAKEALDAGHVHYAPNRGIKALRTAIADKLVTENALDVDADEGVVVTVGCKEAIALVLLAYFEPGEELLVPDPLWDTYFHGVRFAGGTPVPYPVRAENGFQPDVDELEALVTPRSKGIVVVSPSNPTGAVYDRSTLEGLARIALRHDLLTISDEIYEKLVYDDANVVSIGSLPGMQERTITINGFSKAYAMDGWRLGYAAGAPELIAPLVKVHQYTTNSVPTFLQYGGVAAYEGTQEPLESMRREFDRRRRMLIDALRVMPGVEVAVPRGAFYVFPRIEVPGFDGLSLAQRFLEEAHVACIPGEVFGTLGAGHFRLSYATSFEAIEAGMQRMHAMLERLHA